MQVCTWSTVICYDTRYCRCCSAGVAQQAAPLHPYLQARPLAALPLAGAVRLAADWKEGYAVTTDHSVQQYDPALGFVVRRVLWLFASLQAWLPCKATRTDEWMLRQQSVYPNVQLLRTCWVLSMGPHACRRDSTEWRAIWRLTAGAHPGSLHGRAQLAAVSFTTTMPPGPPRRCAGCFWI